MRYEDVFRKITQWGLERVFQRFYGLYRATVVDNADPERRGRVRVSCPAVNPTKDVSLPDWLDPAMVSAGTSRGYFNPPEVGDSVVISFAYGDPTQPEFYLGGWYGREDVPPEFAYSDNGRPESRGIVTRGGHVLRMVDTLDSEELTLTWHKTDENDPAREDPRLTADRSQGEFAFLTFNSDGVILSNAKGELVYMDAENGNIQITSRDGHQVGITPDGLTLTHGTGSAYVAVLDGEVDVVAGASVKVNAPQVDIIAGAVSLGQGASFKAVLGELFLTLFNTHTHPSPSGPTGPPAVPATPALLSDKVRFAK